MQISDSIVIIPTYNERENIENIIRAVFGLPKIFHILVIEDGSPDGTANIVKTLQQEFPERLAPSVSGVCGSRRRCSCRLPLRQRSECSQLAYGQSTDVLFRIQIRAVHYRYSYPRYHCRICLLPPTGTRND